MNAYPVEAQDEDPILPTLRRDLTVTLIGERGTGLPSVVVTDPVRGAYYRLSWPESGLLLLWRECTTVSELIRRTALTYGVMADRSAVLALGTFVHANFLTDDGGEWRRYAEARAARRRSVAAAIAHNYLFFRVPLCHPEPWLEWLVPRTRFLFARLFWVAILFVGGLGAYFAMRQWSAFTAAAADALRLEGLVIYAVAVLALKAVHELGHALTTVRLGCRVPTMGIAFMLATPVFYTDTTDSWRLAKRSERLAIVFAGVAAEAIVASFALLAWSFLPDGLLRQICFALATTSIVLSITVNLNPFMRFDGYYALSDWLRVPNLQARSFSLALWKLREALFDLRHPPPEHFDTGMRRLLILYAVATAYYRLILYLGIAAVVYVMARKALGIILALFEIAVFIAAPVAEELRTWWRLRAQILQRRRCGWTIGITAAGTLFLLVPWIGTVAAPAMLVSEREEAIYLPFPARLTTIATRPGARVVKGQVLFAADASDLDRQLERAERELHLVELQLARLVVHDREREHRVTLEARHSRAREKVQSVLAQSAQLVIRAPFDGVIVDLDPEISIGLWLNHKRPLARITSAEGVRAHGMVSGDELSRIVVGASAVFVPDDAAASRLNLQLISIAPASVGRISDPVLADRYGGGVPASEERGEFTTKSAWFDVVSVEGPGSITHAMRGILLIGAARVSPAQLAWRRIAGVLVREHGF